MNLRETLKVLRDIRNAINDVDDTQYLVPAFDQALKTLERYRSPDAEGLAASVKMLIDLERVLSGCARATAALLDRFQQYAGQESVDVSPPQAPRLPR